MAEIAIASVDRRVEVLDAPDTEKHEIRTVSQLRDLPHVVILSEPGGGKTTVLDAEAARWGTQAIKVRALLNGERPHNDATKLFLDALDEYRSDGQEADKAHRLAGAIRQTNVQAWWLSCRAEDWRKEADVAVIRGAVGSRPIVVVQLLPLSYQEALDILRAWGESAPEAFLDKAESLGADGFIRNPLSLRLLRAAVQSHGSWPSTRFDLFDAAVRRLAHEKNAEHKFNSNRPSSEDIISAADTANLMLLASGAQAIWRSNDEPPGAGGDTHAYVRAHDLSFESSVIDYTLDTALFRGEGEAFEPMHRTVAEFTAARALAQAVRGVQGYAAAFPLSRALALITGQDGSPPTELRGLFAWFAAHLSKLGDREGAIRLIQADAPTVLLYGDAAAFDSQCRREILKRLTESTPYPRSHENGTTSTGGLAGEDLAEDFAAILRAPLDGTQRMYTVLDALQTGPSVLSLKPILQSIALDVTREDWVRWRAANAWLNGQVHPAQAWRDLFDTISAQPISLARESVRLHLAESSLAPELTLTDIKSLIGAFRECGRDGQLGRMDALQRQLETCPKPELFEEPVKLWLRENTGPDYQHEIDSLLDHALAACIRGDNSLDADRLLSWVLNASYYDFPQLEDESKAAISEWISLRPDREVALFRSIMKSRPENEGAWMAVHFYSDLTGKIPQKDIVSWLILGAEKNERQKVRMLELAIYCVNDKSADIEEYWKVFDRVENVPELAELFDSMRACKIEGFRDKKLKWNARQKSKDIEDKLSNCLQFTPLIPEIKFAKRPDILFWGAQLYFRKRGQERDAPPCGVQGIVDASSPAIADAVVCGWRFLLMNDFSGLTTADIGKIDAEGHAYSVELAALAGLDEALERDDVQWLAEMPIAISFSALRRNHRVHNDTRRRRIKAWSIARLNHDIDTGSDAILEFLNAAIDAGATDVALIAALSRSNSADALLMKFVPRLLEERPGMPAPALRRALAEAGKRLSMTKLHSLTQAALARPEVTGKSKRLWHFLDFMIAPQQFDGPGVSLPSKRTILATFDLVGQEPNLIEAFDFNDDACILRTGLIVAALGRFVLPSVDYPATRHMGVQNREEIVRKAINSLSAMTDLAAGRLLSRLIAEPALVAWRNELMHARFQHRRLIRDRVFKHPTPQTVRQALAGTAPVNAADLRAITIEELRRLQCELRTSANSPWKHYWNTDGRSGRATQPKIENHCRDHLLERLRDRLLPYGIAWAMAEIRHPEDTRADIAILSHAGKSLPIEIKRDSNAALWHAAETQLMGYAEAETSEQIGIYLVFWFDHPDSRVPPRPSGGASPASADDLQLILSGSLSEDMRDRIDVIVFDVSDPDRSAKTQRRASKRK